VRDVDCAFKLIDGPALRRLELRSDGAMISAELYARAVGAGVAHRVGRRPSPPACRRQGVGGRSRGGGAGLPRAAVSSRAPSRPSGVRRRRRREAPVPARPPCRTGARGPLGL
jgi:hypothetical protein